MEYLSHKNVQIPKEIYNYLVKNNLLSQFNNCLHYLQNFDIKNLINSLILKKYQTRNDNQTYLEDNLTIEKIALLMCLFDIDAPLNTNPEMVINQALYHFDDWAGFFPPLLVHQLILWLNIKS